MSHYFIFFSLVTVAALSTVLAAGFIMISFWRSRKNKMKAKEFSAQEAAPET